VFFSCSRSIRLCVTNISIFASESRATPYHRSLRLIRGALFPVTYMRRYHPALLEARLLFFFGGGGREDTRLDKRSRSFVPGGRVGCRTIRCSGSEALGVHSGRWLAWLAFFPSRRKGEGWRVAHPCGTLVGGITRRVSSTACDCLTLNM